MSKKRDVVVGIDLGTTNSVISVYEGGEVIVIPNSEGKRTTPSIISFDAKTNEVKVGDSAKRQAITNPKGTIHTVKRLIGKTYDQVKGYNMSYNVVDDGGRPSIKIGEKKYSPEEISAMILQKMKKTAEDYLGFEVSRAVISVPAYFNNDQRNSTKIAAEIAGFKVERIINEPTAAVLAANIKSNKSQKVVIVDIGGGTTDFSVVDFSDGVYEVLSTDGDDNLGGELFDNEVVKWICDEYKKENGVDLRKDPMALQRIKEASEKSKIELSSNTQSDINLPYITVIDGVPSHLVKTITRSQFDRLIQPLVDKAMKCCKGAIDKSKLKTKDIDNVILVGGSTRIELIQKEVEKFFGKSLDKSVNADESISVGCTIQGGIITGDVSDILLLDVLGLQIGIDTMGGKLAVLVESNTTIPTSKEQMFSNASDQQTSVELKIYQGERPLSKDNKLLGNFNLDITPMSRGQNQIAVSIDIDADGILSVKAIDKSTGKENSIRIEGSSQLSKEEIERMKQDAIDNLESDKIELEKIEKLNSADSLIFSIEKQIKELSDKISTEDKSSLESAISELKKSHSIKDMSKLDDDMEKLTSLWGEISSKKQPDTEKEPSVSDVDFEEVA
jgi:molecular chaperone DnaK